MTYGCLLLQHQSAPPSSCISHGKRILPPARCSAVVVTTVRSIQSRRKQQQNDEGQQQQQQEDMIVVSILGPPNAGKSTLFNRLMCKESNRSYRLASENRRRKGTSRGRLGLGNQRQQQRLQKGREGHQHWEAGGAIVSSVPGTTRDRRECIGRIGGTKFRLMDTAGVDGDRLLNAIRTKPSKSSKPKTNNPQQHHTTSSHSDAINTITGNRMSLAEQQNDDPVIQRQMMIQTLQAALQSDLIFLMFDARVGVTQDLIETARWLRKHFVPKQQPRDKQTKSKEILSQLPKEANKKQPSNKDKKVALIDDENTSIGDSSSSSSSNSSVFDAYRPSNVQQRVVLLANKLEGDRWIYNDNSPVMDNLNEAARIGFGEAIPISAEHGEGMADLSVVIEELTQLKQERRYQQQQRIGENEGDAETTTTTTTTTTVEKPLQLAMLGQQNVGKSTLVNRLLNEERVLTGETPGLTRDSIAVEWKWNGRPVQLVDTAGIRRVSRRDHSNAIENMAVLDAMRAMKVADVAVLVLDAESRMLQRQELAIADAVAKEGRALVVAANKMDLIVEQDYTAEDYAQAVRDQIEARLPILRKTPVVVMSSLSGEGVRDLMPVVFQARQRWAQTVATGLLNRWLADVMVTNPPPPTSGRPTKIKYIIQTKGRPPTFLLFCNVEQLPDSYVRFLMRHFQDSFEMFGMEVRMSVKKSASKGNPYHDKAKRGGTGVGGRERHILRRVKERKETTERILRRKQSRAAR